MERIGKIISVATLIFVIASAFSPRALAAESCWYVRRNGECRPGFPADAEEVSQYDGFYIDNNCERGGYKRLYLTFDVGYENGNVEKILNVLKEKNVPAAFFVLDNIILKNTDLVMRMTDEGHLVCNHTKRHRNLSYASAEEIAADLQALEKIYTDSTGLEMSKYFRFPEGRYSIEAMKAVQSLGYKTVFWSFGYEDWDNNRQPSEDYAVKKILSNTHNGAVILLHPTSTTNANILSGLIDRWREMGYEFGTLDQLTA